jgi:hypothetical protein
MCNLCLDSLFYGMESCSNTCGSLSACKTLFNHIKVVLWWHQLLLSVTAALLCRQFIAHSGAPEVAVTFHNTELKSGLC